MSNQLENPLGASRREFLKTTAATVAGSALVGAMNTPVHAAGDETLKIALVGCGKRGAGALAEALKTEGPVKLWALADTFRDRMDNCLENVRRDLAESNGGSKSSERIDCPAERQFIGLDAYRHAIDSVDVVLLAESPGFRPKHFEYAVKAGKHVFMEKPVATDPAGIRRVLAAAEEAKRKNLKVGVGLQRRHQPSYLDAIPRIRDGEIGELVTLRCYWNGGNPAKSPFPHTGLTELEYQIRNWYFFTWLSGDHICEQHVHNIDVCNWIKNAHPVEAQGLGGRQVRTGKEYGNIFDHHSVEFTYADGTKMFSQCRQIPGCANQVAEFAHGTQGVASMTGSGSEITVGGRKSKRVPRSRAADKRGPYQIEHDDLFEAIRKDTPYNEAEYAAMSTMTAILGRMATYSGKVVQWDAAFRSEKPMTTDAESWGAPTPVQPDSDGRYAVAVPGVTNVV